MRPLPESGGRQRGAELFLFPLLQLINILFHFKLSSEMKKKTQSGKVPVSKLQAFFSQLSGMLSQEGSEFFVNRSDDGTTSIRLSQGQYLTISMQKGGTKWDE